MTVLVLLAFHVAIASVMYVIAHSPFLIHLHQDGFWNFALDSVAYHKKAALLVDALRQGDLHAWWHGVEKWPHVKWIALCYWILGVNSLSFELINAPVWVATLFVIWRTGTVLFDEHPHVAYVPALLFGFLPSYLMSTTQLLKDPVCILGLCLMMLGWVLLFKGGRAWRAVALLCIGFLLITSMRGYLKMVILPILGIGGLTLLLARKHFRYAALASLGGFLLMAFWLIFSPVTTTKASPTHSASVFVDRATMQIDHAVGRIDYIRQNFGIKYKHAQTNTDMGVRLRSLSDIINYLPRAMQLGFFSPFPNSWMDTGRQTGRIGRMIAGCETLLWYVLLIASIYCWWRDRRVLLALSASLLLSFVVITLLGLVVPNMGTLYRMRIGYLIPFYITGAYGIYYLMRRRMWERVGE